jgi:hypothetical protein
LLRINRTFEKGDEFGAELPIRAEEKHELLVCEVLQGFAEEASARKAGFKTRQKALEEGLGPASVCGLGNSEDEGKMPLRFQQEAASFSSALRSPVFRVADDPRKKLVLELFRSLQGPACAFVVAFA